MMFLMVHHVVALTLVVAACGRGVLNETKPIVFLIQSDEGTGGTVLPPTVLATEFAVRDVNESTAAPSLYSLEWLIIPSQCNGNINYTAIFDTLMEDELGPVIILEGTCLEDSKLIAEASRLFDFTLVSYSPACLAKTMTYLSNHFCVVPTSVSSHYGIAGVFAHFGWKRAEIITEVDYSIAYDTEMLVAVLKNSGIEEIREIYLGREVEMEDLIVPDYHILILNTSPEQARDIICEAEVGYPNYLWIIPDWYPHQWWTESGMIAKCSQGKLETFLERSIVISYQPEEQNDGTTTVSGRAPDQFRSQFDEAFFAPYAYDSVWIVHLGLGYAVPQILETCASSSENFISCSTDAIRENFEMLNFLGVSGPVSFDNGTRTLDQVTVLQFRRGSNINGILSQKKIACISTETRQLAYKDNENVSTVWPNGTPPDGTPIQVQNHIFVPIIVVYYVFAAAGIVFAIVCFAFTCIFRKRKLIRLTSPHLNYVIIVGAVLLYLSIVIYAHPRGLLEATEAVICPLASFLPTLGYNLAFGTINVKMWRVYYIFHKPYSVKKRAWKDWHLMIIVAIFVLVDMITLTVTTAIPAERNFAPFLPDPENPNTVDERGVPVEFFVIQCVARSDNYWLIAIYAYKGLLQIIGVVLAFLTRKVKVKYLNESSEVRRIIYLSTVILLVVLIENFVFITYINVHAAVFSFGLCTMPTLVLGFIFIPKMIGLYRDPQGKLIFEASIPSYPSTTGTVTATGETNNTVAATNMLPLKTEELEIQTAVIDFANT